MSTNESRQDRRGIGTGGEDNDLEAMLILGTPSLRSSINKVDLTNESVQDQKNIVKGGEDDDLEALLILGTPSLRPPINTVRVQALGLGNVFFIDETHPCLSPGSPYKDKCKMLSDD